MIFSRACCTLSPELLPAAAFEVRSLSISSMKTIPCWAFSMFPSALSSSRCSAASISSLAYLVCASEVASAVTKGTFSIRDSVSQSSVLPVPEGPTSKTLLLAIAP
ncbi:MAG: hypothetical protein AW07_01247 [Candidatus Accumulibacter sp. SK-11]|nr:MAG: hypothetical protein AW07_01247 [Candidatus Accumulibacter sp. SK-11]